jgi:uncharacterized protein (TIGR02453 family)
MAAYFTKDFIQFFIDLSRNNHKDWFDENRKRYEQQVKAPFLAFTTDFVKEAKKLDKNLDMDAKKAIFRINKDIRFSKDKSPYKLHMAALVNGTFNKDWGNPHGLYYQLSAEGMWLGGGIYQPDKPILEKIRAALAKKPKEIDAILAEKSFKKLFGGTFQGEQSKILPKELKEAAEKQPLIYNKQFYYASENKDPKVILKPDFMQVMVKHLEASMPVAKWLEKAIK